MKTAITAIKQPQTPPAPRKGDIEACKHYANHLAENSDNAPRTLAHVWITFITFSYLQDSAPTPEYTGWKVQQVKLAKLQAVQA